MNRKQRSKKPPNCVGCDFLKAALKDAQEQFNETEIARNVLFSHVRILKEEIERIKKQENDWATIDYKHKLRQRALEAQLAHSDLCRRQLERDVLAQSPEMAPWKKFHVRSTSLIEEAEGAGAP